VEEIGFEFELSFWTRILDIGSTAIGFLHMFSFALERFLKIPNLAFDGTISTVSANAMETNHSRKKDLGSIQAFIQ
jgi:uncharacterized protein YigE (DUF2233 family)